MVFTRLVSKWPGQVAVIGTPQQDQLDGQEAALAALAHAVEVDSKLKLVAGNARAEDGA